MAAGLGWLGLACILLPVALVCAVIAVAIVIAQPIVGLILGAGVGYLGVELAKRHVHFRFEDDER